MRFPIPVLDQAAVLPMVVLVSGVRSEPNLARTSSPLRHVFCPWEVGELKVSDLEPIYRIAPVVTDCHRELPDRWSRGRR